MMDKELTNSLIADVVNATRPNDTQMDVVRVIREKMPVYLKAYVESLLPEEDDRPLLQGFEAGVQVGTNMIISTIRTKLNE